jgi:hypothetical protein
VSHEVEIKLLVAPDEVGVEDLIVRHNRDRQHRDEEEERDDGAPIAPGEFDAGGGGGGTGLVSPERKYF